MRILFKFLRIIEDNLATQEDSLSFVRGSTGSIPASRPDDMAYMGTDVTRNSRRSNVLRRSGNGSRKKLCRRHGESHIQQRAPRTNDGMAFTFRLQLPKKKKKKGGELTPGEMDVGLAAFIRRAQETCRCQADRN